MLLQSNGSTEKESSRKDTNRRHSLSILLQDQRPSVSTVCYFVKSNKCKTKTRLLTIYYEIFVHGIEETRTCVCCPQLEVSK